MTSSRRCLSCGRELTDAESVRLGLGPFCRKTYIPEPESPCENPRRREASWSGSERNRKPQVLCLPPKDAIKPTLQIVGRQLPRYEPNHQYTILAQCWKCGDVQRHQGRRPNELRCDRIGCYGNLEILTIDGEAVGVAP